MSKPAHKIRIFPLQVTIWRNTNEKGTWYSVNHSRSYKDGDDWKESTSLSRDDLLVMRELHRQAFVWITKQEEADAKARKARSEATSSDD
jgi:hypothetical protein